jgi:hypothetical protein
MHGVSLLILSTCMTCREWIEWELRRDATSNQIIMRAAKALFENQHTMGFQAGTPVRDHYITHADIDNVKRNLDKETWRKHDDDVISTEIWIRSNPSKVILYHPPSFAPYSPFRLVIQREMQLEWLIRYGNGACVAIDGTHGTQKYRVLFVIACFLTLLF